MQTDLQTLIARWDSGEGKPYKGRLIDWYEYDGDGKEPPTDIGCMCAQGQVLHLIGGWEPRRLHEVEQEEADRETAKLLGISIAHAILLRNVNDKADGAPSVVLTHPEKVLGDQAHIVLAFWRHLDRMTNEQWEAARAAARVAARDAATVAQWDAATVAQWETAWEAARDAATVAQWEAARVAARVAARAAARVAARVAAWDGARVAARVAAWDGAANACSEIQGARILREQGKPFFFLPMFGFADPEAVLAADKEAGDPQ